jgi:putative transposase
MGEKNINGRKRQLWVDSRGALHVIWVHAADLADREALVLMLDQFRDRFPRVVVMLVDAGYRVEGLAELEREYGIEIRIVEKPANQKGFVVQKRRWIVERSIGWWGRYRRLVRDYEGLPQASESWIHLASIGRLLQRLFPDPAVERPYKRQPRTPAPALSVSPLLDIGL